RMVGQETLSITANKRNCQTMLYLDNCVMGIGSIRLFATVGGQLKRQYRQKDIKYSKNDSKFFIPSC
ncbi:MAG: hypothetical protein KBG30_13565, partial [Bacteroidales bacterium]|nr:hypothetical protein [Bacteroidales bacterium]